MSPRRLALTLVLIPGLALAQAPDTEQPSVPPSFGDPDERTSPTGPGGTEDRDRAGEAGTPLQDRPASPMREGQGEASGGGQDEDHGPGMHQGHHARDHGPDMMRMHHGMMRQRMGGQASIAVETGDRRLMIACGDTPIADCVAGAEPLLDLLR